MAEFLLHIGWLTVSMSVIILLVLLFQKIFGGKFSAKSRYIVWTVVVFSLCIGTGLYRLPSLFTVEVEMPSFPEEEPEVPDSLLTFIEESPSDTALPGTAIIENPSIPDRSNRTNPPSLYTPSQPDEPQEVYLPVVPAAPEPKPLQIDIPSLIFGIWVTGTVLYGSVSTAVYIRSTHKYARSKKNL